MAEHLFCFPDDFNKEGKISIKIENFFHSFERTIEDLYYLKIKVRKTPRSFCFPPKNLS